MNYKNIFPARLLSCRKELGISQKALADVLGVSDAAITMMEKGKRSPSFEILCALADYFHVPTDFLTGRGIYAYWDDIMDNRESITRILAEAIYNLGGKSNSIEEIAHSITDEALIRILPAFLKSVSHDESGGVVFELYFDPE